MVQAYGPAASDVEVWDKLGSRACRNLTFPCSCEQFITNVQLKSFMFM